MSEPNYRHLSVRTVQGVHVLTLIPRELHGDTMAEELRDELLAAVAQDSAGAFILDFQHVQHLSSVAFRPLLNLRRKLQESGGRLVLCNLSPMVAEVFQITRLITTSGSSTPQFEVQPDVDAAVASLKKAKPAD